MSETAQRSGARLDTREGHGTVVAFPDELFSHLHFDRRTRAWRGPDEIVMETADNAEQSGTLQMRCA
jgi:hypothetical protein